MGYEIYGFLERKNVNEDKWEPALILTSTGGSSPLENIDISYIWACGRTAFNEELVSNAAKVDKEHVKELIEKVNPLDKYGEFEPEEMFTISYGSLYYVASESETPDLAENFINKIKYNAEILDLDQMKPDFVRFTFAESY